MGWVADRPRGPAARMSGPQRRWRRIDYRRYRRAARHTPRSGRRGNRTVALVAMYLVARSGVCFRAVLVGLRHRLHHAKGESGPPSSLTLRAGLVFVALLLTTHDTARPTVA